MNRRRRRFRAPLALTGLVVLLVLSTAPIRASAGEAAAGASESDPPSDEACPIDGPLAGAWEEVDGQRMLRFREREYAVVLDGRLDSVAAVVECRPGRVKICSFGRRHVLEVTVEGDRLEVYFPTTDKRAAYRRLDAVPEVFDPEPLEIPPGEVQRLAGERVEEIRDELGRRRERDQAVRQPPIDGAEMMRVDRDNTAYLKELLRQVGWIDPRRFGPEAADAAFLIVQHSGDLPLLLAALPELEKQGRLQEYALLYDRLQNRRGRPQRYGTQVGWTEDGTKGLLPIETLEGIDETRAEMGLPPLDDYLARFDLDERRVLDCR